MRNGEEKEPKELGLDSQERIVQRSTGKKRTEVTSAPIDQTPGCCWQGTEVYAQKTGQELWER